LIYSAFVFFLPDIYLLNVITDILALQTPLKQIKCIEKISFVIQD